MSIIRVNKTKDYSVMSNYHLRDKNLSLKAKGLLSVMLSLPNEWDYSVSGLVLISKENETSINSTLKELKANGYLVVTKKMPNETASGRIEYEYDIFETPKQGSEKQDLENLGVEFLGVEVQGVENQGQLNTNNILLNNKDTNNQVVNKELVDRKNIKKDSSDPNSLFDIVEIVEQDDTQDIFNYWNTKDIIKHREINNDIEKAIKKALKEHTVAEIKLAIDRYAFVYHDDNYYFKHKWGLDQFLKQANGYKDFLDNGSKWENYVNSKAGQKAVENIIMGEYYDPHFLDNIDMEKVERELSK